MSTDWRADAKCRGADPTLFDAPYPRETNRDLRERVFYVRNRYCLRCPVIAECRAAQQEKNDSGIWAGRMHGDPKGRTDDGCGTDEGHQRHRMLGETPCYRCRRARTAALAAEALRTSTKVRPLALPECGTWEARRYHGTHHQSCVTCAVLDEVRVRRFMDGHLKARRIGAGGDPELNEAIARLRASGMTCGQIGDRVGLSRDAVLLREKRERGRARYAAAEKAEASA